MQTVDSFPSRVEIDLAALASNARQLKQALGPTVALMAVVKANAYGHGAVPVAQTALASGAAMLAVANLAEALELRQAGIAAPILVLSYLPAAAIAQAIAADITVSLYDWDLAQQYRAAARTAGGRLKAHLKVDSGMGRLGLAPPAAAALCEALRADTAISLEGIYTHFSAADEDPLYTAEQLRRFQAVLERLHASAYRFKYIHAANSAAALGYPASHFNLARIGLALYGLNPSPQQQRLPALQPVMAWKTTVIQLKTLPAGSPVGYGNAYRTSGSERIATLPVGYADGLRRAPQTWRAVLLRGQRAPIVGRVSMEKTTINVSHIPEARLGDEVVLLGQQGADTISADEVADWIGSINYEALTSIAPRAPRIFLNAAQAASKACKSATIARGGKPN